MFPLLKFRILENSMSPFLNPGDLVIIFKTKNVKNNDVIIFDKAGDYYVKRVKKVKGDSTSSRFRGASKYYVVGDNKKESVDSRKFGWIDKQQIIGKIIYKF